MTLTDISYSLETGIFIWLNNTKKYLIGKEAGCLTNNGYIKLRIGPKQLYGHRVAWFLIHGYWPKLIDHINGIKTDNRIENLREVNKILNGQNRKLATSISKTGLLGSSPSKGGKYEASIKVNNKKICLGYYNTPEEAHIKYLESKRLLHEGNTL